MYKVGIVTYYDAINEGAFLQAYCLKTFLEENFDVQVYFVENNQINNLKLQRKRLFHVKNPRIYINNICRYAALVHSQKRFLQTNKKNDSLDLVIVGSDEMWNVSNALFCSYNVDGNTLVKKRISYAVSMGNFSEELSLDMVEKIKQFYSISVRDYNAKNILENSGIQYVDMHLDPVFLIDIQAQTPIKKLEPYLMVYGNIRDERNIGAIKNFAHKNGFKIVSVDIYNKWCDINIPAKNPFEFVGLIDSAQFIVTNMFHGTMLSIVRKRPFISIQTSRRRKKMTYVTELFKVSNRCIDEQDFKVIEDMHQQALDGEYIDSIIDIQRSIARNYFNDALESN